MVKNQLIGEYDCNFCILNFRTRAERNDHVMEHFERKSCSDCNKILIRIADDWYEMHVGANCNNTQCELELNIKAEDDFVQIIEPEVVHYMDSNELSNSNPTADISTGFPAYNDNTPKLENESHLAAFDGQILEIDQQFVDMKNEKQMKKRKRLKMAERATAKVKKFAQAPISPSAATIIKDEEKCEKIQCNICDAFIQRNKFEIHLRKIHVPNIKEPTDCTTCGRTFVNKATLKTHQNTHLETKNFVCSFCGRDFTQMHHLRLHTNTHTGEKPYSCNVCQKSFGRDTHLIAHKRIHTGEKPFKCPIEGCERAYAYAIDLKRHKYSIHGIYTKKHICPICSKIYSENKLLKKHLESHSV